MGRLLVTALAPCLLLLVASACEKEQQSATRGASAPLDSPSAAQRAIEPPAPGSGTGMTGLSWKTPADWVARPPSSAMRKAQYRVPGEAGDAECVVFYFGPGQGGDAMANAERWAAQWLGVMSRFGVDDPPSLPEVVERLRQLLLPIFESLVADRELKQHWTPPTGWE